MSQPELIDLTSWTHMDEAPRDGTLIEVLVPAKHGLPGFISDCSWHNDTGFCVVREPIAWRPKTSSLADQPSTNYRRAVVAWLRRKETKWRETASARLGLASDAASFYAAAYHNAANGVERGEPERNV